MDAVNAVRREFDKIRGRLFEMVEATGMAPKQEEALKKLIRRLTYDAQANLEQVMRERVNGRG
jgi:hypothetical protein